jgi:type II restriction enzyme
MKGKEEVKRYIKDLVAKKVREMGISSLSLILQEVKREYETAIKDYVRDVEQSWKAFKDNLLEEVILDVLKELVEQLGLKIAKGSDIEKREELLEDCLCRVKRSVLVDYGEFGMHLPDIDLVIYCPYNCQALAIISSKATLRERIAQTGYWKLKLSSSPITKNIKVFFITLDEDGDFRVKSPAKKGRAIAEVDTDGVFLITSSDYEESQKVKGIEYFEKVLKELIKLCQRIHP